MIENSRVCCVRTDPLGPALCSCLCHSNVHCNLVTFLELLVCIVAFNQIEGWVKGVDALLIDAVLNCELYHKGVRLGGVQFELCAGVDCDDSPHIRESRL